MLVDASHAQIPNRQQQNQQQQPQQPGSPQQPGHPTISSSGDEVRDRQARELAKKMNLDRQAALKKDTDTLLKLAVELKDSVDKSNADVLSLDVVKKAEEIEKLAHSVRDKMKGPS